MRNIFVVVMFFVGTPLMLFLTIFYLSYSFTTQNTQVLGARTSTGVAYAALPPADSGYSAEIGEADSREEILRQFLQRYDSPLVAYAPDLIAASERYEIDFRLLPAISVQESGACRRIPENSFNCWGWGIYGGKVTRFSNYPEAIETISKGLYERYHSRGLITPHEVGTMYNPSNTNNWAENVTLLMKRME